LLATSRLAGSIRPENSARAGLIPVSIMPILTPCPVAPFCQAEIAPDDTAPFER